MVSPLTSHITMEGARVHRQSGQRRSNKSMNKEQPQSGRYIGRLGGYKTPPEQPRQARRQANSSGDTGWPAIAMCLQGQAINYV